MKKIMLGLCSLAISIYAVLNIKVYYFLVSDYPLVHQYLVVGFSALFGVLLFLLCWSIWRRK